MTTDRIVGFPQKSNKLTFNQKSQKYNEGPDIRIGHCFRMFWFTQIFVKWDVDDLHQKINS